MKIPILNLYLAMHKMPIKTKQSEKMERKKIWMCKTEKWKIVEMQLYELFS